VSDVEASSRWYQRLLGCESAHGGPEYERLVANGALVMQLHRWEGFFFPGRLRHSARIEVRASAASVHGRLEVDDVAITAFAVLGGMLADCRHHEVSFRSAYAALGRGELDLMTESGLRPAAVPHPPFAVELPQDLSGNYALLVEIELAQPVQPEVGHGLLDTLAL
jgi:hypothetical protein